ncbi:RHS repeat-associated core domain-containing protein [Lysobacter enzymogenes]|nr:RHS repeat-associated core domain-containing protein [Lysobacter enzymogenes]
MSYDALDRLSTVGSCSFGGDCWHRFSYDAVDNLRGWSLGGVKNHRYVYNDKNQLTNLREGENGPSVVGLGYDVQGNLNNKNGQAYEFDYGNRLRQTPGKETYVYDAHGHRLSQSNRADTTFTNSFYNLGGQLLFRYEGHANEATNDNYPEINRPHIYLGSSLLATVEWNRATGTAETRYYHTDALSSPVAVTNAAGQVVERTDWEPYGAAIGKPSYDGVGYTGHVTDGRTGLTYMQQRYFDPQIGRFLSVDPVTAVVGGGRFFNRYTYAFNNPFKFNDPDGRCPVTANKRVCIDSRRIPPTRFANIRLTAAQETAAKEGKNVVKVQSGATKEKLGSLNEQGDGSYKTELVAGAETSTTGSAYKAAGKLPANAKATMHGHTDNSQLMDDKKSDGDIKALIQVNKPNVAVATDGRMAVWEVENGVAQVRAISGHFNNEEIKHFEEVIDNRQRAFNESGGD